MAGRQWRTSTTPLSKHDSNKPVNSGEDRAIGRCDSNTVTRQMETSNNVLISQGFFGRQFCLSTFRWVAVALCLRTRRSTILDDGDGEEARGERGNRDAFLLWYGWLAGLPFSDLSPAFRRTTVIQAS
ncbi:hypothetical protein H2200_013136 [Cladophialophora chaetospira]|uniref:Uncharacterized protein n=1 Tax=Cladophialophora chaetospira TaxID=386627 RepID=A0AA38WW80_9EURO|nr:hypothetical protein H2200_013136 [Cladophialophora chaetospira]